MAEAKPPTPLTHAPAPAQHPPVQVAQGHRPQSQAHPTPKAADHKPDQSEERAHHLHPVQPPS
jgi:hypothetical protein